MSTLAVVVILAVLAVWTAVAAAAGIVIGRGIRIGQAGDPRPAAAEPKPTVPTEPSPAARVMLHHEDLVWSKAADDDQGPITLGLLACPGGQLGVLMDDCGEAVGVRLDRFEVQDLRDALGRHLVDTSRPVTR